MNQQPFEGSEETASIISNLLRKHRISAVIETGTQRGATIEWFCRNFPELYVVTIELDPNYFLEAFDRLKHYNVTQMIGRSSECLLRLRFRVGERVLFFLDAHGGIEERTPLLEELASIGMLMEREGIVPWLAIHDCQVPEHPELGFDVYGEQIINRAFIEPSLLKMGFAGSICRYNSVADGAARGLCYLGMRTYELDDE